MKSEFLFYFDTFANTEYQTFFYFSGYSCKVEKINKTVSGVVQVGFSNFKNDFYVMTVYRIFEETIKFLTKDENICKSSNMYIKYIFYKESFSFKNIPKEKMLSPLNKSLILPFGNFTHRGMFLGIRRGRRRIKKRKNKSPTGI